MARLALSRRIAASALRVALVVGVLLNAINEGKALLTGGGIHWLPVVLNFVVPYCVASYAAARNEARRGADAGEM